MTRIRKLTLVIAASVLLLAGATLWALPEIVRRVALDRIPKITGRAVAIGDVDLNLFTGRLAIKGFRLADRPGPEALLELERLDVRVSPTALLRSHVHLVEIVLTAPSLRIVRTGPVEFNFSDLFAGRREEVATVERSRWTVTVGRLSIARGSARLEDRAVSPASEWLVQDLDVDARNVTTRVGAAPGLVALRARINEALLTVEADSVRLDPTRLAARVSLEGFETRRLNPYVYTPLGTPYRPVGGRFSLALTADVDSDAQDVRKASLAGTLGLEGEAFVAANGSAPFVSATRVGVEVREADLIARTLTVKSVTLEGLDFKARRDSRGVIDLVEMFTPTASRTAAAPSAGRVAGPPPPGSTGPPTAAEGSAPAAQPAPPPREPQRRTLFPVIRELARGFQQIHVERFTLTPSTALFVDERVRPTARLALTKLQAQVDDFRWPATKPATLALSTGLPGGGTLDIRGPMTVAPFDANLAIAIRNAPVEPYQPYIPIPARLSGRYNGDSQNRIAFRNGTLVATSKGNSWGENVELREPGALRPAIRVERMELRGIDFDWPRRAGVARAGFRRPRVEIERGADGTFNVRRLFATPGPAREPEPEARPTGPSAPEPKGLLETMRLDFREVRIEDGFVRFLDRTVTPAFSQDLSRLDVTLTDYGNRPDRRAKVVLQSVVGGDGGLDIRGELGPLWAPAALDLVGELRSFKLPSVDPYAVANTGWLVKQGELQYKFRFKLDGNQLSAENDLVVGQLQVAPASGGDEVKRRIGLPLGLIVALIKDQRGDIRVNVPVAGPINDPKFSLGDAIWTAIKNVLANVVAAPFKAIGRLFSRGGETEKVEEPKVDPVTFAAGSAVLSPAMENHLFRVADVLRRAPYVSLALTPVPSPADAEALRNDAVTARLEALRKARGLPDTAGAVAAYYEEQLPGVPVPPTVEEQVALLRQREPVPDASLVDLGRRRMEATRERLVAAEGISAARLTGEEATRVASPGPGSGQSAPDSTGEGRVEFAIVAGQ